MKLISSFIVARCLPSHHEGNQSCDRSWTLSQQSNAVQSNEFEITTACDPSEPCEIACHRQYNAEVVVHETWWKDWVVNHCALTVCNITTS